VRIPNNAEVLRLCEALLQQITEQDIANLTEFAECRLVALGLSPASAEDVVQRAFESILRGLESDQGGRRPRLVDVVNKEAFLNYLRGAVSSKAEAATRRRELRHVHEPYEESLGESGSGAADSPVMAAEFGDLAQELFARLRQRAPARLKETIDAWESVYWDTDRIPTVNGQRRQAGEVRQLAQSVMLELIDT
jgi:DNA-directed RNA polymerase specialized sigma24 family protein